MSHAIETASAEQLRAAGLAIVAVEELDGLCHSLRSTSDELMLTRSKLEDLEKRLLHSQLTVEQQTEMYRRARVDADAMTYAEVYAAWNKIGEALGYTKWATRSELEADGWIEEDEE